MDRRCVPFAASITLYALLRLLGEKFEGVLDVLVRKWDSWGALVRNVIVANSIDSYHVIDAQAPAFLQAEGTLLKADCRICAFQPIIDAVPLAKNNFIDGRGNGSELQNGESLDGLEAPSVGELEDAGPFFDSAGCVCTEGAMCIIIVKSKLVGEKVRVTYLG